MSAAFNIRDEYLTRQQAAEALNCDVRTIYRATREKDGLVYAVVAGKHYFHVDDLKAWIERRKRRPGLTRRAA
jgi:excisionase family DNA binding protein